MVKLKKRKVRLARGSCNQFEKVKDSMSKIDYSVKEAAYHVWLITPSEKLEGITTVVEQANRFVKSIGLAKASSSFRKTVLSMGLKDILGIHILERVQKRPEEKILKAENSSAREERFSGPMAEKRLVASSHWADMNYDILVKIFSMLSTVDLILNVSLVCSSWRAACGHPSFWHTLDLARFKFSVDDQCNLCALLWNLPSLRLMQMLNSALILSRNNVTRLIFSFGAYIEDSHLIAAAERCPRVKQLVLPAWNQISVNGFSEAIKKLTELESLTLPCDYTPNRILQLIGMHCPKLSELKVMAPFDYDFANALLIYLPKLKVLSLRCSTVHKDALRLTLTLFSNLRVLNISHSLLVDIFPVETPAKFSWGRDPSIGEQALRMKTFLWCQNGSCTMCRRVMNDAGRPNWREYEESLWRQDEVSSFYI